MSGPTINCPYCGRDGEYPELEELFASPGTEEDPNADCAYCVHCGSCFDVVVPGGPTGGWRTVRYSEAEQEHAQEVRPKIENMGKSKAEGLPDPDGGVDEQAAIETADAVMRDIIPNGGLLNDEQSAKFAAYLEEGMREQWEAELAAEAGVLSPIPKGPPAPDDPFWCPMCRERGQFPEGYRLTDPIEVTGWRMGDCAFPPLVSIDGHTGEKKEVEPSGPFTSDNWTCGALSKIRDLAGDVEVWSEDQHVAVLPWYGDDREADFLLVSYYKHRGRTDGLWLLDGKEIREATYPDVVKFLHDQACAEARRVLRCRDEEVEIQWDDVRCEDCGAVPDLVLIQEGPEYRCTCGWRQLGPSPRLWRHLSHE